MEATHRIKGDYAKEKGKCITFDPNYRPPLWPSPARARAEITWGLEQADVIKISEEELSFLWDCGPEAGARRLLEEFGASLVMVTLGPKGCYLKSGQGACLVPAPGCARWIPQGPGIFSSARP